MKNILSIAALLIWAPVSGADYVFIHEVLYLEGTVESGEESKFRKLLDRSGDQVKTLCIENSPGGDLASAMSIGRILREKGIDTQLRVPEMSALRGTTASAAVLLFLAGRERCVFHGEDGKGSVDTKVLRIGLLEPSKAPVLGDPSLNVSSHWLLNESEVAQLQFDLLEMFEFFIDMLGCDAGRALMARATAAPERDGGTESAHWLTEEEMLRLGCSTKRFGEAPTTQPVEERSEPTQGTDQHTETEDKPNSEASGGPAEPGGSLKAEVPLQRSMSRATPRASARRAELLLHRDVQRL